MEQTDNDTSPQKSKSGIPRLFRISSIYPDIDLDLGTPEYPLTPEQEGSTPYLLRPRFSLSICRHRILNPKCCDVPN